MKCLFLEAVGVWLRPVRTSGLSQTDVGISPQSCELLQSSGDKRKTVCHSDTKILKSESFCFRSTDKYIGWIPDYFSGFYNFNAIMDKKNWLQEINSEKSTVQREPHLAFESSLLFILYLNYSYE